MSARLRWVLVIAISFVALGGTATAGAVAWAQYQARQSAPSAVDTRAGDIAGDRIVFRNTAAGAGYGHVSAVSLGDPDGLRAVGDLACDRVDATDTLVSCLRIVRGITPSYTATLYDAAGAPLSTWPLAGIPSRTRISPAGDLIATTAFVTGHSYATIGFSTETTIHTSTGDDLGNLESWTLLIDDAPTAQVDRNYWGITFIDDTSFYATAGLTASGTTYLVRGDVATRTLTALATNVECPSLSPDGTRVAFKRVTSGSGPTVHWTPAVYDIATGRITLLPEPRRVDDQIEWLDDDSILYGMPRDGVPGDTDVWSLSVDGTAAPSLFIEQAWSPAVVRG